MGSTIRLVKRGLRNPRRVPAYLLRQVERPPLIGIEPVYRLYLLTKGATYAPSHPDLSGMGDELRLDTLRTASEYDSAVEEVRSLGLHPHFHGASS